MSILDDGIQTNHPDLAQNYVGYCLQLLIIGVSWTINERWNISWSFRQDPLASTDINDNDNDPMPRDNGDNKHGTRCAGEVAAVAFNSFCGVGIAFNASIGGIIFFILKSLHF